MEDDKLPSTAWLGHLKTISVWLKISSACVGFIAAALWVGSALSIGTGGSLWNAAAAVLTAIATCAQGISALIDWRVAPSATWA